MKKVMVLAIFSILLMSIFVSTVSAATNYNWLEKAVGTIQNGKYVSPSEIQTTTEVKNSPLLKGISIYVFGFKDLENAEFTAQYGITSIVIIFIFIWLILFLGFSDIFAMFSGFSTWVSWIIGFAVTVIAANLKVIQIIAIWAINFTAIFGTIAVFIGLIMAFVAFLALSIGSAKLRNWALDRKMGIYAHKGQAELAEGINTLRGTGSLITKKYLKMSGMPWWAILVAIGIVAAIIVVIMIISGSL